MAGYEDVVVGPGGAEVGGVAGDPDHPLPQQPTELGRRHGLALDHAGVGVPLPIGGDPVDVLLQHVPRFAVGRDDRPTRVRRGEVGSDLVPADPVAVDQRPTVGETVGSGIVEGVQQLAR